MTKKVLLLLLSVLLVGALLYLSKDWFAPSTIRIGSTVRPNRLPDQQQRGLGPALKNRPYTVAFLFNRRYPLKSVRVVKVREIETNRFAHPLWKLISDSNSIPVKSITYGIPIQGMRPEVEGAQADPLEAGVPYRLLVETPEQQGTYDFTLGRK